MFGVSDRDRDMNKRQIIFTCKTEIEIEVKLSPD